MGQVVTLRHLTRREALAGLLAACGRMYAGSDWVCPMHPEVRNGAAGLCPKCQMALVQVLDWRECVVEMDVAPRVLRPNADLWLTFRILEPDGGRPVRRFATVHEKLFHLFLVSEDLSVFQHVHPALQPDGWFMWAGRLPQAGMYRLLCDFLPEGGSPQMVFQTLLVSGSAPQRRALREDLRAQQGANTNVSIELPSSRLYAGRMARVIFRLSTDENLQPYLGAAAHLLAASEDLIDMMHAHPEQGSSAAVLPVEFVFPRAGIYRVWLQFQREGMLNTVSFNVPVAEL